MRHTTLTLAACLLCAAIGHVEASDYSSYTVTVKEGLSNSSVNSILQDKKGLVWLSTWDGINVYNGSGVKIYKNNPNDENSLLDNIVRYMVQEDERYFWAVTDWGLSRLDTYTDKFTRYRLGFEKSNPFSGSSVSMTIDSEGRIFCSSRGWGVASYDRATDRMVPFNISDFNTSAVSSIVSAGGRSLILQTVAGRAVKVDYDIDAGGNVMATFSRELLPESTGQYAVSSDSLDIYLVGREFIYRYDKTSGELTDSVAFSGSVSYTSMSPDGKLYVVSDRADLFCVDFDTHTASAVPQMHRDNLLSFCFGTQGIIWLAVDGVGLEACTSVTSALKKIDSREFAGNSGGAVTAIEQVSGGDIYVSILGGGLYVLDSEGNAKGPARGGIPNGYIFSMVEAPGDNLFIGVRNAVVLYRPSDGGVVTLKRFESTPPVVVYCMYYDSRRDNLWIGTLDSGVFCLELNVSGGHCSVASVRRFCHDRSDGASLSSDNVMHIAPSGNDCLWVGTLGGGLNLLDINTGKCTHFLAGGAPGDLPNDNARFAFEDAPGSVWVGTSYGLAHGVGKSPGGWSFSSFSEKDGLADNTVHSILKDKSGRIWLGTNRGLSVFDPSDGTFTNQDNADNLQGWEFYVHSCMMTADGEMYFGGVNGLNHFFPEDVRPRDFCPDVMIDYLSVRLDDPRIVNYNEPVILRHNENFFNIGFTAMEYINNANCEYAYTLEGFGKDWVTVPAGIPATFTNVPPGKYVFKVRSTNGDKAWCDNEVSLGIVIKRPWYLTGWAYFLYFMTAVLASVLLNRYRNERQLQKDMLAREALEKEKQKENYEAKLNFFTNIAHEFGTPLTLISCSGERLADNLPSQPRAGRYVRIINDNASRMQKLIQELLEFRKVDTGHYEPVYKRIDVSRMLSAILEDFTGIGEEHNITLNISAPKEPFILISDEAALEKILINLISNAYKYTPDGGTVDISLEKTLDGGMHFTVTNTSKGLSREKLSRVFDRFVILDNLEQQMAKGKKVRNGVGMALVYSFVNTLGGYITVDSVMDKSVTFDLILPSAPESSVAEQDALQPDIKVDSSYYDVLKDSPAEPAADAVDELPAGRGGRPSILIVDDDAAICDMVADILEETYNVVKASDGMAAIDILRDMRVDLVITDMNMPKMNGIELIKSLKNNELTKFIPVVFLAFKTDVSDEINSYNLGSEAFIPKPFIPAQLIAIVGNILKNRTSLKDYYTSAISDMKIFEGVSMTSRDNDFITSIVEIVEKRISDDLSPADVAAAMCVSEMTLYRRVKDLLGKSPGEFIRTIKLNRAATLLRTTSLTVQEIMFDCGFNNKSWFYRKFAETYNMSPKEYRKSST